MEKTGDDSQRRVLVAVDGSKPSELAMQCEFTLSIFLMQNKI